MRRICILCILFMFSAFSTGCDYFKNKKKEKLHEKIESNWRVVQYRASDLFNKMLPQYLNKEDLKAYKIIKKEGVTIPDCHSIQDYNCSRRKEKLKTLHYINAIKLFITNTSSNVPKKIFRQLVKDRDKILEAESSANINDINIMAPKIKIGTKSKTPLK